jgi:hypothetical protein
LVKHGLWEEVSNKDYRIIYDTPSDLWGEDDRIKAEDINNGTVKIEQSLYLIEVTKLKFFVNDFKSNRARFEYNDISYNLAATMNPAIFKEIIGMNKAYNNVLTISLAGPYFNRHSNQYEHFKLAAAVF